MDFTNVAVATGGTPVGPNVSHSDTAFVDVVHPAIQIDKTPESQVVVSGGTVTFTLYVTNTGDITLTGVAVLDVLVPG